MEHIMLRKNVLAMMLTASTIVYNALLMIGIRRRCRIVLLPFIALHAHDALETIAQAYFGSLSLQRGIVAIASGGLRFVIHLLCLWAGYSLYYHWALCNAAARHRRHCRWQLLGKEFVRQEEVADVRKMGWWWRCVYLLGKHFRTAHRHGIILGAALAGS